MRNICLSVGAIAAVLLSGCKGGGKLIVTIHNGLDFDRTENVSVPWSDVESAIEAATPQNVVVIDADGNQVLSQIEITEDENGEQLGQLLFQARVAARGESVYTVKVGDRPAQYEPQVGGRYVPERKDDYAWENDIVAFRIYGKALEEEMISPGVDVWCKKGGKLVIDEWYKLNDYHHNHGDGMDCYKVGVSLGAGASVPVVDTVLFFPHNWARYKNIVEGAVSKSFELEYDPFEVNGSEATLTKQITIDAGSNFYDCTDIYTGSGFDVAIGVVRHNVKQYAEGENWLAFVEPASDSDDPERDGDIYLALISLRGDVKAVIEKGAGGHSLIVVEGGENPEVCYTVGAGWSGGNVADFESWVKMVEERAAASCTPLYVSSWSKAKH